MADKKVNVKVILHAPGSNPPYHFESNDVPIDKDNVIYFSNCGKLKGFEIHYELDDTDNPGYRFPTRGSHGDNHLDEALWVTQSGGCPTAPRKWPVFEAESVANGGLTLVVKNKNEDVENFFYTLRVAKGANWLELDPGGTNQNGGMPFTSLMVGVIAGAVCALGAAALASNVLEPAGALIYGVGGAVVGLIVGFVLDRF